MYGNKDTRQGGLSYSDVAETLTLRQKVSRCFWLVGQCRRPVTWQLECHSAQECAGHYTLLTVHLSHPKHDWFDCRVCWRGPLSDPQGPNGIHRLTCKVQVGCIQPQHFSAPCYTWCCSAFCQMLYIHQYQATHWITCSHIYLQEKSHILVESKLERYG